MSHAEICPLCNGTGRYFLHYWYTPVETTNALNPTGIIKTCHGCNGKGWVRVEDGEKYELR